MKEQNTALLGAYIHHTRESHGWSLRELAAKANISHTTVDNIEHGYDPRTGRTTNITLDTLTRLSAALEVDAGQLLACLDGTAHLLLSRPMDAWREDEREDVARERGGVREYLRLRYGRGEVVFPASLTDGDTAVAKRCLFGTYTPTDEEWAQVVRFAEFLKNGK